jgi:drug/metabolite transporter (DMT)-like permease
LRRLRNWLLFFVVVLIWSLNWPVMKKGLDYVDPLGFVFHRFLFAAILLFPFLLIFHNRIPKNRETLLRLLLLSVINAVGMASTNIGLVHEKSGLSAVITYTQPLFVFCMATLFLKEKTSKSRILGLLIGFSGVVTISAKGESFLQGVTLSILPLLLGAFLWAVTIIYFKRYLTGVDAVVTNAFQMMWGAALLGTIDVASGIFQLPFSSDYWIIMLYASVAASGVAFTIWMHLLREEEATVLSSSSFIIPIATLLFGWLLLGETVEPQLILGAALILSGVYLVNRAQ